MIFPIVNKTWLVQRTCTAARPRAGYGPHGLPHENFARVAYDARTCGRAITLEAVRSSQTSRTCSRTLSQVTQRGS